MNQSWHGFYPFPSSILNPQPFDLASSWLTTRPDYLHSPFGKLIFGPSLVKSANQIREWAKEKKIIWKLLTSVVKKASTMYLSTHSSIRTNPTLMRFVKLWTFMRRTTKPGFTKRKSFFFYFSQIAKQGKKRKKFSRYAEMKL